MWALRGGIQRVQGKKGCYSGHKSGLSITIVEEGKERSECPVYHSGGPSGETRGGRGSLSSPPPPPFILPPNNKAQGAQNGCSSVFNIFTSLALETINTGSATVYHTMPIMAPVLTYGK